MLDLIEFPKNVPWRYREDQCLLYRKIQRWFSVFLQSLNRKAFKFFVSKFQTKVDTKLCVAAIFLFDSSSKSCRKKWNVWCCTGFQLSTFLCPTKLILNFFFRNFGKEFFFGLVKTFWQQLFIRKLWSESKDCNNFNMAMQKNWRLECSKWYAFYYLVHTSCAKFIERKTESDQTKRENKLHDFKEIFFFRSVYWRYLVLINDYLSQLLVFSSGNKYFAKLTYRDKFLLILQRPVWEIVSIASSCLIARQRFWGNVSIWKFSLITRPTDWVNYSKRTLLPWASHDYRTCISIFNQLHEKSKELTLNGVENLEVETIGTTTWNDSIH